VVWCGAERRGAAQVQSWSQLVSGNSVPRWDEKGP